MSDSGGLESLLGRLGIPMELVVRRGLREYPEAVRLEVAEAGAGGREHLLTPPAARAWRALRDAAVEDEVVLFLVSAFRSVARQIELVERKLAAGVPIEDIVAVLAPPGFSEHHTGRAVDVGTPGCPPAEVEFDRTTAFRWLRANAERFGFFLSYPPDNRMGYQYEPWHWCYRANP